MLEVEQSDGSFGGTASVSLLVAEKNADDGLEGKKGGLDGRHFYVVKNVPDIPAALVPHSTRPPAPNLQHRKSSRPNLPAHNLTLTWTHLPKTKTKKSYHSYPPQPSLPHSLSLPPSFTRNPHPNPHPPHPSPTNAPAHPKLRSNSIPMRSVRPVRLGRLPAAPPARALDPLPQGPDGSAGGFGHGFC